MIQVIKRDGTRELFDPAKLAAAIWLAMNQTCCHFTDACHLAAAIGIFLRRRRRRLVSSAAIFEMVVRILRKTHLEAVAEQLEAHRLARTYRRHKLQVRHDGEQVTMWDKSWLSELASRSWHLLPVTGRIIAGRIEERLIQGSAETVSRQEIVEMLNEEVASFGLAEAVPVPQAAPHCPQELS
jgi:transcriptional regulator NrdR family protein